MARFHRQLTAVPLILCSSSLTCDSTARVRANRAPLPACAVLTLNRLLVFLQITDTSGTPLQRCSQEHAEHPRQQTQGHHEQQPQQPWEIPPAAPATMNSMRAHAAAAAAVACEVDRSRPRCSPCAQGWPQDL